MTRRWVSYDYARSADSDSLRKFLGNGLARAVQCDGTNVTSFLERAGDTSAVEPTCT